MTARNPTRNKVCLLQFDPFGSFAYCFLSDASLRVSCWFVTHRGEEYVGGSSGRDGLQSPGRLHLDRQGVDDGNKTAIENRRNLKYYMDPPGPGALARFEYTWGEDPPKGAHVGTVLQTAFRR